MLTYLVPSMLDLCDLYAAHAAEVHRLMTEDGVRPQ